VVVKVAWKEKSPDELRLAGMWLVDESRTYPSGGKPEQSQQTKLIPQLRYYGSKVTGRVSTGLLLLPAINRDSLNREADCGGGLVSLHIGVLVAPAARRKSN
jgi:hypothetical protein